MYGDGEDGKPTSTYASDSPFPTSVDIFISRLFPLTNVTIPASSLATANAGATSSVSQITGKTGATFDTTSGSSPAAAKAGSTTVPSQTTGEVSTTITGQASATSQKSAAERTWPMHAKVHKTRIRIH